jgi:2-phosphosulfolactate phosphatase
VASFDQDPFAARFDWGEQGLRTLLPSVELIVIVDVLSFSTDVEVAASRGAYVIPFAAHDASAEAFAAERDAILASNRGQTSAEHPYSLSPRSLMDIAGGTRLVLPSLNGSNLTTLASDAQQVATGCLRNAQALAEWASQVASVGVIAAGELRRDGTLRFAIEDLIGAGAILRHFPCEARSPEAEVAVAAFQRFEHDLPRTLAECGSGRELAAMGFAEDTAVAAELNVSRAVPRLVLAGWYSDVASV